MKTLEITFGVQGWVKQIVEVPDNINTEELKGKLNSNMALTTIQEGGEIIEFPNGEEIMIGEVKSVNNECEYTDFEVREI